MSLSPSDYQLVVSEIDRDPTPAEEALFENLWSEHCAYRSSWPLLSAFDSDGPQVVIGPGDDAGVVELSEDVYLTLGIESHNHPSYVDPYDGAATGVGGIVRDTLSMGAYPIALTDSLYFGSFDQEHPQYLFEGVVEGIADYGNSIGVPTVGGSVAFHPSYEGNPLVNVACVGLVTDDRLVTAEAQEPGNALVIVGNATGRDGLGGASFASEDLGDDAATEDRPAVQVGDPYAEKLLIEANEQFIDEGLIESARDLGAAGLGGASSELVAKGGYGAEIELTNVHQREPNMNALEILLAESQERICYEVAPENVERVAEIADRFDLGCSAIGTVTEGNYVCTFEGETVVDVSATFLGDGAPTEVLESTEPTTPTEPSLPEISLREAFESVLSSPNTAKKRWVYRQYDHEVGNRTLVRPGDDSAVLAIDACDDETGIAISAGADPNWTEADPYLGATAVGLEVATNLASKGATPLAAVDCLNGGNPEKPDVYGGFKGIIDGLAESCSELSIPVVGGNVSLYNDSSSGPIAPTPTICMVGVTDGFETPPAGLPANTETASLCVVGDPTIAGTARGALGGSEYLAQLGGEDTFPDPSEGTDPGAFIETLSEVATEAHVQAVHDVSHGGLAVALAEMVTDERGISATIGGPAHERLFNERAGRTVVATTDPDAVTDAFDGVAPVATVGETTDDGALTVHTDADELVYDATTISDLRNVLEAELE
ncbi:phosphoribosylformylglycinamidine synthase subunit PurL [Halocatena halophila]|uniref:phosphoribosylformylglycinamidine synthase subunit PurL n=1 Tax=Halocatena halophila TaxID=2814576 RepID=UPI002ED4E584